jgi:hypothetical protein
MLPYIKNLARQSFPDPNLCPAAHPEMRYAQHKPTLHFR